MNLGQLLTYLNFCANKAQTGGTYTAQDYNTNLPVASTEYFNSQYKPLPGKGYEVTQDIKDSLRRFMVYYNYDENPYPVSDDGKLIIPADYLHISSLRYRYPKIKDGVTTYKYKDIYISTDAQWTDVITSSLMPATKKYPKATFRDTYIQILPTDLKYVEFTYLRLPHTPVFDYYINNSTDEMIYLLPGEIPPATGVTYSGLSTLPNNQSVSVELEWDEEDVIGIANILLQKIGINLRQQDLVQYSQLLKEEK